MTPRRTCRGSTRTRPWWLRRRKEIRQKQEAREKVLDELQASIPTHQRYQDAIDKIKLKATQIAEMEKKIWEFSAHLSGRRTRSPRSPAWWSRPNRSAPNALEHDLRADSRLWAPGIGVVCLLEHIDHSIKVPEHLSTGLTLPLFGVIPRIRRSASLHRGGHLWTPGARIRSRPTRSATCVRACSGITDKRGPIVTLLVTSPKAGEGKSTTAAPTSRQPAPGPASVRS